MFFSNLTVQIFVQFSGNNYIRRILPHIFLIMISGRKELKLIQIYMYVCELYEQELQYYCYRQSNNKNPDFTDQEIITVYLFAGHCQKYLLVKDRHSFAKDWLLSWFPKLPSYQAFNNR